MGGSPRCGLGKTARRFYNTLSQMTPEVTIQWLQQPQHEAAYQYRPSGPLRLNARMRMEVVLPTFPVKTNWQAATYGDPDETRAGPPGLGVDSVDFTEFHGLRRRLLPGDADLAVRRGRGAGGPRLRLQRPDHFRVRPVISHGRPPHWSGGHAPYFTAYGKRKAL